MSDMRFIMLGVALIFAGFIILGAFGHDYRTATFESNEFGTCFEYFEKEPPIEIDCSSRILDQVLFFALIVGFIGAGITSLVKGVRGDWDNKVKPEDMAGPGRRTESGDSEK